MFLARFLIFLLLLAGARGLVRWVSALFQPRGQPTPQAPPTPRKSRTTRGADSGLLTDQKIEEADFEELP